MIVLIDIDEVIADFEGQLRKVWNKKFPHTTLFKNGVRSDFYIGSDSSYANSEIIGDIIGQPGFFKDLAPIRGAKQAIIDIASAGNEVFLVSSPGISYPNVASEKIEWVNKYYGQQMLSRIILTPSKHLVRGDILIDDKPYIDHEDIAEWEHVLYDKSYNKTVSDKRRITWDNWREELPELLK